MATRTLEESYALLGLTDKASECDVKQAYKKMALRHHPDKNPGDTEAHKQFIAISEAFQKISRSMQHKSGSYKDDDDDDEDYYDDDDDEYYEDDDEELFQGRGNSIFEEMFRNMFFEGRGVRGRGGPSFMFNFGRRCDCPDCRNQFRPKGPRMSEQEIAQARKDRKERNMKTKAEREAAAEKLRQDKERVAEEKRQKVSEEREAAACRSQERYVMTCP